MKVFRMLRLFIFFCISFFAIIVIANEGDAIVSEFQSADNTWYVDKIAQLEGMLESVNPKKSWDEAIAEIPDKYGVSPLVVEVLLQKESGGKTDVGRFEQHHFKNIGRYVKKNKSRYTRNDYLRRQVSSSHGPWQVMGWHAVNRGYKWTDLLEPETGTKIAMDVWLNCWNRHEGVKPKFKRYAKAGGCYNGSEVYGNDLANKVAMLAVEQVG